MSRFRCTLEKNSYLMRYRNFLKDELLSGVSQVGSPQKAFHSNGNVSVVREVSPMGWAPRYSVLTNGEFTEKFDNPVNLEQLSQYIKAYQWDDTEFQAIVRLCKAEDVPVIMLNLPEHPLFAKAYVRQGLKPAWLQKKIKSLAARNGLTFLDLNHHLSDSHQFQDPYHLNVLGSVVLTETLAQSLPVLLEAQTILGPKQ